MEGREEEEGVAARRRPSCLIWSSLASLCMSVEGMEKNGIAVFQRVAKQLC